MIRFSTLMLALAAVLLLANCATMPDPVRPDVRSIGIISLMSDDIDVQYYGKFFDGYSYERHLDGAGFDELAERTIEARLRQTRPNATIKRIQIKKDGIIPRANRGILIFEDPDVSDIRAALRPWAAQNNVDVIVIIRPTKNPVPIETSALYFRGLVLFASYAVDQPHPMASMGVNVWDGKTLDSITQATGAVVGDTSAAFTRDNKMEGTLTGPPRERLVGEFRRLTSGMVTFLLERVGL